MDTFKAVTLASCFISVVITVFEALYPAEKFGRQMKLIFSLILVLCIISPFAGGKADIKAFGNIDALSAGADVEAIDTGEYFKRSVENNISRTIGEYLSENEISFSEIKTSINISDTYGISINEIEIAAFPAAREDEIIALVKKKTGEDTTVKIKEISGYEQKGTDRQA